MFTIFTFKWICWQTNKDLSANSITMLISHVIYVSSPTSGVPQFWINCRNSSETNRFTSLSVSNTVEPTKEEDSGQYWFNISTVAQVERLKGAEKLCQAHHFSAGLLNVCQLMYFNLLRCVLFAYFIVFYLLMMPACIALELTLSSFWITWKLNWTFKKRFDIDRLSLNLSKTKCYFRQLQN